MTQKTLGLYGLEFRIACKGLPCSKETDKRKMMGMHQSLSYLGAATKLKCKCTVENITKYKRKENTRDLGVRG